MLLRVRDKKRDIVRVITHHAYAALGPSVYEKLGVVDENSAEATTTTEQKPTPQVHRTVSAPVVKPKIEAEQEPEPEPKEESKPPFRVENAEAQPAKKKPGRPAKAKSISSNSGADEK